MRTHHFPFRFWWVRSRAKWLIRLYSYEPTILALKRQIAPRRGDLSDDIGGNSGDLARGILGRMVNSPSPGVRRGFGRGRGGARRWGVQPLKCAVDSGHKSEVSRGWEVFGVETS